MVPLAQRRFWQKAAQPDFASLLSFETAKPKAHLGFTGAAHHAAPRLRLDCYPSLHLGPDPSRVRPAFRATCAEIGQVVKSPFANPAETADSAATITLQRGSSSCTKPWRLSPFFPLLPLPVALASRSAPTAQHLALSVVRPLALPPRTTSHKAPSLAVFWVRLRAIKAIAGNTGRAAFSGGLTAKAIRAMPRVAFSFAMAPQTGCASGEGPACSRRS